MYSPRIREELIPWIYRAARDEGVPMTVWVSSVLERALERRAAVEAYSSESAATELRSQHRKEKVHGINIQAAVGGSTRGGR